MTSNFVGEVRLSAQAALSSSPIYDLRSVQVDCNGDSLYLSGQVATFYHKQLAQEAVRSLADEMKVVNCVNVV